MVIHGYMACLSVREDGVEISPISYEVGKLNADKRSQLFVSCFLLQELSAPLAALSPYAMSHLLLLRSLRTLLQALLFSPRRQFN